MATLDISAYKMELLTDIYNTPAIVAAIDSQSPEYVKNEPDSLIYANLFQIKCFSGLTGTKR